MFSFVVLFLILRFLVYVPTKLTKFLGPKVVIYLIQGPKMLQETSSKTQNYIKKKETTLIKDEKCNLVLIKK